MEEEWTKKQIDEQMQICIHGIEAGDKKKGILPHFTWEYVMAAKDNYSSAIAEIIRLRLLIESSLLTESYWTRERIEQIRKNASVPCNANDEYLLQALDEIVKCHAHIYYVEQKLDDLLMEEGGHLQIPLPIDFENPLLKG